MVVRMLEDLGKRIEHMDHKLDSMRASVLPRTEFEAYKEDTTRRLAGLEATKSTAHNELHQKIAATETKLRAEVEKVETEMHVQADARQRWARDVNVRVWLAVAAAALSAVGGILVSTLTP
jgi:hypothetical protein